MFINFAGYIIPTGWTVMIVPSVLHLNPEVYADPHTFNPWRWEVNFHIIYIPPNRLFLSFFVLTLLLFLFFIFLFKNGIGKSGKRIACRV